MKNCPVCGMQIEDDAQICPFCNTPIQNDGDANPSPATENAPETDNTPTENLSSEDLPMEETVAAPSEEIPGDDGEKPEADGENSENDGEKSEDESEKQETEADKPTEAPAEKSPFFLPALVICMIVLLAAVATLCFTLKDGTTPSDDDPTPSEEPHVHAYVWEADDEKHREVCTCGDVRNESVHVYESDEDNVCDVCRHRRAIAPFDYLTEDLTPYVEIGEDAYNGITVSVTLDGVRDSDVENEILKLLCKNKGSAIDGTILAELESHGRKFSAGDVLTIYYHGYTLDEDGNVVPFNGGSNLASSPFSLELGSGGFIPGFELALVGCDPNACRIVKITEGNPTDFDTVFVSYKTTDDDKEVTHLYERICLADDSDATYGAGFRTKLTSMSVGAQETFTLTRGEDEITYTDLSLHFFAAGSVRPQTIDAYFPLNYGEESLAGKHVKFDVYLVGYTAYETPAFDDAFVTEKLGATEESLADYAGDTLAEKYRASIRAKLDADYEAAYRSAVKSALLAYYAEHATFPKSNAEGKLDQNSFPHTAIVTAAEALRPSFENYIQQYVSYYSQYGMSVTFEEMVLNFYPSSLEKTHSVALQAEDSVGTVLENTAPELLKQDFAFYAVLRKLDLLPDAETYAALFDENVRGNVDDYFAYYKITPESCGSQEEYNAQYKEVYDIFVETYGYDFGKEVCLEYAYDALIAITNVELTDPK